jgi:asparagine synthase (glutamine-hydrolysing)
MCGIAGVIHSSASKHTPAMVDAMRHRGPDGRNIWRGQGVSLGVQRLAIMDHAGGQQPLIDDDLVLVANGEIYNHVTLREKLEAGGARFKTQCDVEVIIHAYRRWNVDMLDHLQGQFAIGLWDNRRRTLLLARDRLGIAPLVWTPMEEGIAFASEVKGLLALPEVSARLDPAALDDFLAMRFALGPRTFFQNIQHIPPGHRLTFDKRGIHGPTRWYEAPRSGTARNTAAADPDTALKKLEEALTESIARRRQGEGDVALYLSGGLDSSMIGALATRSGDPLLAFTHGFNPEEDETRSAHMAAESFGSPLKTVSIGPETLEELPAIVRAMEQPVANSDVLGLWALAKEASKHVRVVLCGEGADELFGSYPHIQMLHITQNWPTWKKKLATKALRFVPKAMLERLSPYPGAMSEPGGIHRLERCITAPDLSRAYDSLTTLFTPGDRSVLYTPRTQQFVDENPGSHATWVKRVQRRGMEEILDLLIDHEMGGWLDGYHLGRGNRIALAHGVEARYPFLDEEVVKAVLPLPVSLKFDPERRVEKLLLRTLARPTLPPAIVAARKGPVRVPLPAFDSAFEYMLETHLSTKKVRRRGIFRVDAVAHLRERRHSEPFLVNRQLFAILMVEIWCAEFMGG